MMGSLIENYEQQYAVLTAEITAEIGKLSRLTNVADQKELASKINTNLEEVQELLEQIGLEITETGGSTRIGLTSRLGCYQAELKRLRIEFVNAKNSTVSITIGGGGASAGTYDSSDFDEIGIKEEQQRRLLDNSERIERTGNRLADGYRTILETENIGTAVLQDLSHQRESLQRSRNRLRQTNEELSRSSRIMNSMIMRSLRERAALVGIVGAFILVVSLSIYFSVSK